jgi:hypothetical protein
MAFGPSRLSEMVADADLAQRLSLSAVSGILRGPSHRPFKAAQAILDGEIVCLDGQGRSVFADLLYGLAIPYFYAFELLWLDGVDWRRRALMDRKAELGTLIESEVSAVVCRSPSRPWPGTV